VCCWDELPAPTPAGSYYTDQLCLQEEQNAADADFSPFYAATACACVQREAHSYKCPWEGDTHTSHTYVCTLKIAHLTMRIRVGVVLVYSR